MMKIKLPGVIKKYIRFNFIWITAALFIFASARAEESWGPFPVHKDTRELCSESVLGTDGSEILWRSYALHKTVDQVVAFYQKRLSIMPAAVDHNGKEFRKGTHTLSIYPVAYHRDIPHCFKTPMQGEKSILLISHFIDRWL